MSSTTTRRIGLVVALAATLAAPSTSFAKGGGGGGGGGGVKPPAAATVGVIKNRVGAAVACDGGTTMSLAVQKGNNKVVERVITMSGSTAGWWDFALREDSTGRGLVVSGSGMNDLGASVAVITTSTGSTLAPGTWDLTFTATRRLANPGVVGTPADPLLETCVAHVTVVAV